MNENDQITTGRPTRLHDDTIVDVGITHHQPPAVREPEHEDSPPSRQSVTLPKTEFGHVIAAIAGAWLYSEA